MNEITDSLGRALERIRDFPAVQAGADCERLFEAVKLLQESVGVRREARRRFAEHLAEIGGSERAPGHVLLGAIVGLIAADLEAETRPREHA